MGSPKVFGNIRLPRQQKFLLVILFHLDYEKDRQYTPDLLNQAVKEWDLQTLYGDLAFTKGKPLTPTEKLHLRGLLCGYSPSDIADKLHKNSNGVETDLCASIYRYVKSLLDKCDERIDNWRKVIEWLEESGYKNNSSPQVSTDSLLTDESMVNISNITVERDQIVFQINLHIPTSQASEIFQQNPDLNNNASEEA